MEHPVYAHSVLWIRRGIALACFAIAATAIPASFGSASQVRDGIAVPASLAVRKALAPPPRGVAELRFGDIYRNPVGPLGLELSERALALDGRRVRIVGFMVAEEEATPGVFMLSPLPAAIGHDDEGLADDLPPSTVFVHLESAADAEIPRLPGLIQLQGTLSVGARSEDHSGRVSAVRLLLDKRGTRELLKLSRRVAAHRRQAH
jgi:hypothetical protein